MPVLPRICHQFALLRSFMHWTASTQQLAFEKNKLDATETFQTFELQVKINWEKYDTGQPCFLTKTPYFVPLNFLGRKLLGGIRCFAQILHASVIEMSTENQRFGW